MTIVALRCTINTCQTQNGKSLRSVFVCCWQIIDNHIRLELFCLDRNHCQFSSAYRRSPSCSRVRTMCCRRHIGVLCLMLKTCLLLMPHILRILQPFAKRCTMIISTRVTLENSLSNVCMFWWWCLAQGSYISILLSIADMLFMLFLCHVSCFAFRWRVHRAVKLTADQWNRVKTLFLQYVPQFFPNDCMLPVFVPLNGNVLTKLEELQQEKEELQKEMKQPAPAADAAAEVAIPSPAAPPARDVHNHPPLDMQDEQPHKKRRHVRRRAPVAAASAHAIDMDGDMQVEERKEATEERGVQWELAHWFSPAAPFLPWYAPQSQPDVQWKALEPEFPRLALLARRFLSIPPTSAPSERVWSRFGRVISKQSSTINYTIAAQIMFLRDNECLLNSVDPFDPASWSPLSPSTVFDLWIRLTECAKDCIVFHWWWYDIVEYISFFQTILSIIPFSPSLHPHTVSVSSWETHNVDTDTFFFFRSSLSPRFPFFPLLL